MSAAVNFGQIALSGAVTAIFHPTGYAKVLIQIGHEPLAAEKGRSLFGKDVYYYPNIFRYTNYIWNRDGFFGMYKGLVPRLLAGRIGNFVETCVQEKLKEYYGKDEEQPDGDEVVDWLRKFCRETGQQTISRCLGIVASQPFHVIMLRQMAQFVGGETHYDGMYSSVTEIYRNEGFGGFFAGLAPRLLGEIIQIWLSNLIAHLVNKHLIESKVISVPDPKLLLNNPRLLVRYIVEAQSYTSAVCGLLISHFTYPFTLVSNVMAVSAAELVASSPPNMPPFSGWMDCWSHLKQNMQIKRGSSIMFRTYTGPLIYSRGRMVPSGLAPY